MFSRAFSWLSVIAVAGCASTEVNFNALDVASTYDTLLAKQVVFNVLKMYYDQYGIPAYVRIGTQTSQTTDAINPIFSFPFSPQTTLKLLANGVVSGKALQTAGRGISLQAQVNRQQNYTLSPTIDPDQLRRLRSIYQYVTGYMSQYDFESDYPIIQAAGSAMAKGASSATEVSGNFGGNKFDIKIGGNPPGKGATVYVRRQCKETQEELQSEVKVHICVAYQYTIINPDETFIKPPGCVMCDFGTKLKTIKPGTPSNVILLEKNDKLRGICPPSKDHPDCTGTRKDLFSIRPRASLDLMR